MPDAQDVYVWDRFVRIFHWTLAAAFAVAFLAEEDALVIHVWAGYVVGGLIILRVIWGMVGPKYARFTDFVYGPRAVAAYIRDLLLFKAKRHVGHSPGGGAMIVVLLFGLAVTVGSGLIVYGVEDQAGPLAPFFSNRTEVSAAQLISQINSNEDGSEGSDTYPDRERGQSMKVMEGVHEFFANLTLGLVLLHIGAVLLAGFVHRENLFTAMVTGYKRR